MKKTLAFGIAASTLLISSNQVLAGTLTIDNFDYPSTDPEEKQILEVVAHRGDSLSKTGSNMSNNLPTAHTIGGSRELFIELEDVTPSGLGAKAVVSLIRDASSNNGLYSINYDADVRAITTAKWDGNGEGLNTNLIEANTDAFDLDIMEHDIGAVIKFTIENEEGLTASIERMVSEDGDNIFKYEDFDISSGTMEDIFSDVESISMEVTKSTKPTAIDFIFDSLNAVGLDNETDEPPTAKTPEPTAVLSLFALGFGALLRRNKKA